MLVDAYKAMSEDQVRLSKFVSCDSEWFWFWCHNKSHAERSKRSSKKASQCRHQRTTTFWRLSLTFFNVTACVSEHKKATDMNIFISGPIAGCCVLRVRFQLRPNDASYMFREFVCRVFVVPVFWRPSLGQIVEQNSGGCCKDLL